MDVPPSQDLRSRLVIRSAEPKPNRLCRFKSGAREWCDGNCGDSNVGCIPPNRNPPPPAANASQLKWPGIPLILIRRTKFQLPNTACKTAIRKMAATSASTPLCTTIDGQGTIKFWICARAAALQARPRGIGATEPACGTGRLLRRTQKDCDAS